MSKYINENLYPILNTHEFGRIFLKNIHHFEHLQEILSKTQHEWIGCGSYLMNGHTLNYCVDMFEKQCLLYDICKNINHVLEIGVHGGHSLFIMLLANPKLKITCIDLCEFSHVQDCLLYLSSIFTECTIQFYKGSSIDILPNITDNLIKNKIDFSHIDGNHDCNIIKMEMDIILNILEKNNFILFDDISGYLYNIITNEPKLKIIKIPQCVYANCLTQII